MYGLIRPWARYVLLLIFGGGGHTVPMVCPPPHLWSCINLNMFNNQVLCIKSLGFSIAFSIFQKLHKEFSTLLWPPTSDMFELFSLGITSSASIKSSKWNTLLLANDILKISVSPLEWHTLDGLSSF